MRELAVACAIVIFILIMERKRLIRENAEYVRKINGKMEALDKNVEDKICELEERIEEMERRKKGPG